MIPVVDAGNTTTKLFQLPVDGGLPLFRDGVLVQAATEVPGGASARWATADLLEDFHPLAAQLEEIGKTSDAPPVLVSVIPALTDVFVRRYRQGLLAGRHQDVPYAHAIQNPESVGPDRWINVAAAVGAGLSSALVVDAGTATTIDLLLDGTFIGGLIAPGMEFAARHLARQGAMLPEVAFGPRPADVGTDTRQAMERGAWLVGTGGVEWALQSLQKKYAGAGSALPVILTGGLGHFLRADNRHHDPLWTVRGAAWWTAR